MLIVFALRKSACNTAGRRRPVSAGLEPGAVGPTVLLPRSRRALRPAWLARRARPRGTAVGAALLHAAHRRSSPAPRPGYLPVRARPRHARWSHARPVLC